LEKLIGSSKSNEIELIGDKPTTKSKSIDLKSKGKFIKVLQAIKFEETQDINFEEDYDVQEMTFFTKRLQYLNKKKRRLQWIRS